MIIHKMHCDPFDFYNYATVLDTAGRLVANGDQNHIWVTRYCQKTSSNWPKFKYLGEYKYYSIYILFSGYSIK
jgi:hypothetical protein